MVHIKTRRSIRAITQTVIMIVVSLILLSGCGIAAFSPENASVESARAQMMPDFKIDPATIQVLQKQPVGKGYLVLTSFQGTHSAAGRENCLFSYYIIKGRLAGWTSAGGGGGCSNAAPDPNQPISIGGGGGSGGGGLGNPGYCSVEGQTFNPDVQTVQVTWSDDTIQQAKVISQSYVVARSGRFDFKKVEALDASGQVIYTWEPEIAPGKQ